MTNLMGAKQLLEKFVDIAVLPLHICGSFQLKSVHTDHIP